MLTRRQFLLNTLKTSSLVTLSAAVPGFLTRTARAAPMNKDTVLVVLEMTGGNDGLNTVVPYADDLYQKARPTLRFSKQQVVRIDDYLGLNPAMRSLEKMLGNAQLSIVQGVGYPNPNRSHFESMDIWQSADPTRKLGNGWLGRGLDTLPTSEGAVPGIFVGKSDLPLALTGSARGMAFVHPQRPFDLHLGGNQANGNQPQPTDTPQPPESATKEPKKEESAKAEEQHRALRRQLIQDLTREAPVSSNMLPFVQRTAMQTYTTLDRLREVMKTSMPEGQPNPNNFNPGNVQANGELGQNLNLVAKMIQAGFGTRLFYLSLGSFDTHSGQAESHGNLLRQIADSVTSFFDQLEKAGNAKRVLLLTFSEFGRRVYENGSRGTDHGSGSCLFLAGPRTKGGPIGKHPSLSDLDDGDLRFHTDFRQVYATLLDNWLGCNSQQILGGKFEHLPLLKSV